MKMKRLLLPIVICTCWTQLSQAQIRLGNDTTVAFATVEEARRILAAPDDFVRRMSPFDRAARMKTDRDVSEKEYLEFVGKNVLAWSDREKQKMTSAFLGIQNQLGALSLPFPKTVFMIKTTGKEEGRAAYTRANAIILPQADLAAPTSRTQKTICHELFHIMSRANPQLRDKLYAIIGFVKCDEVAFPKVLTSRKLTNPDAPRNDHCIGLQANGKACWAIPILFSSTEKYDANRGGEFFHYLQFQFLLVHRDNNTLAVSAIYDGLEPALVEMKHISGFYEQVGRNTGYIIHPEEILADNFALLVLAQKNVRSPQILDDMRTILADNRTTKRETLSDSQ